MDRISHIIAQVALPDPAFWYTLCIVLLLAIIWGIKRWLDSNKDTFDKHGNLITEMGKCIIELTTMTKIHEHQIKGLIESVKGQADDIDELRNFYIVTYKK